MYKKILLTIITIGLLSCTPLTSKAEEIDEKKGNIITSTMDKINPYIDPGTELQLNDGRNGVTVSSGFKWAVGSESEKDFKNNAPVRPRPNINLNGVK